jgi:SPP1 family predicted phage head-tail adaptor
VTIEEQVVVRDTYGAETITWSEVDTVWGAVEPLTGRERYDRFGAQELATADTRIRIRYRSGLDHKMRVVFGSRTFDIKLIMDLETRNRELHLICEEKPEA